MLDADRYSTQTIAVILAAGVGSRLEGLNGSLPKACLKVGAETLLDRNLRLLRACGVYRTRIVSGFKHSELVSQYSDESVEISYNPFFQSTNTLASLWFALGGLDAHDVVLINGDTIFEKSLLVDILSGTGDLNLVCDTQRCGEEEVKYITDGGLITQLGKSIDCRKAEGEFIGLSKVNRRQIAELRNACERRLEQGGFRDYYEAAYQDMIQSGIVSAHVVPVRDRSWCEIDFPADLEKARALFAETT